MNIILDMDGTLVSQPDIIPRPFLAEFLKYCFRSFNSVSIWTAASREHFNFVNETIFKPILDEIKGEWGFVYTEERCSVVYNLLDGFYTRPSVIKCLKKVWKRPGYTKHNTLIVDDNPSTYCENYGNAIPIDTYTEQTGDNKLESLVGFLAELKTVFEVHGTIRHVEKRFWL